MSRMKLLIPLALFSLMVCNAISLVQAQYSYQGGEVLIVLRPGVSIETVNARFRTKVLDHIPETRLYRLALPDGANIQTILSQMYAARYIDGGEPNYILEAPEAQQSTIAFIDPSNVAFIDRSSPASYFEQSAFTQVHAAEAQELSTGRDVVVAVIDTGIAFDHPALRSRIASPYYDFVNDDGDPTDEPGGLGYGHGTFISGIIALLAPDAAIMPLRALDADGHGYVFNIAKAIYFAVDNGAQVINISFGMTRRSEIIRRAIKYARNDERDRTRPVVLVASAGNDNRRDPPQYPAWDQRVFAVAAVDSQDIKAEFSNFGWHVSFSAPGVDIYSTYPKTDAAENDGFAWWSGTSFAAPFVAAQVALILERFPGLRFSEIDDHMQDWYRLVHIGLLNPDYRDQLGRGRIDLLLGVQ